jgi:flavin reductase (DIM6/NTAB) family NADH-FMN oxidoreductase RutF
MTANAFASVSLDPVLLVCVATTPALMLICMPRNGLGSMSATAIFAN